MQFYLVISWHSFLSYQLLLVLISWLYVSHCPNPALKGEWDFSKIVVIGRGGGGGEWKIFARNGGKPGKGWVVGFIMRGWEIFTVIYWLKNCCYTFSLSFTDWRIAAILSFFIIAAWDLTLLNFSESSASSIPILLLKKINFSWWFAQSKLRSVAQVSF